MEEASWSTEEGADRELEDLENLVYYFKNFEFDERFIRLNLKIKDCIEMMQKFIAFISEVLSNKSHCVEVFFEDLRSIWEVSNLIKTASGNFTKALNNNIDRKNVDELLNLLMLIVPENHQVIKGRDEPYRPIDLNPDGYSTEISKYVEIGKILCETDCITKIRDEIKNLEFNRQSPSTYAAIVGPSFTGKTQTAFTLSHLMDVFYVNIASVKVSKDNIENADSGLGGFQDIYSKFDKISTVFQEILRTDVFNCKLEYEDSHTASKLSQPLNRKYLLLGFILLLVRWKKLLNLKDPIQWFHRYRQVNHVIIPKLSIEEFNQKCNGKQRCFFLTSFILL